MPPLPGIASDEIARRRPCHRDLTADSVVSRFSDGNTVAGIAQEAGAGDIRADKIALDQIVVNGRVVGAHEDPMSPVTRNDVTGHHVCAADHVGRAEDLHAIQPVAEWLSAGGVSADEVALNHVVADAVAHNNAVTGAAASQGPRNDIAGRRAGRGS